MPMTHYAMSERIESTYAAAFPDVSAVWRAVLRGERSNPTFRIVTTAESASWVVASV